MSGLPSPSLRAAALGIVVLVVVAAGVFVLGFGGTNQTVGVSLENHDDGAHELDVRVTYENETLLNRSASLDSDETRSLAFQNPATAGDATLSATLAAGDSTTRDVRVGPGTGIRGITVEVTTAGDLSVYAGRT